MVYGIIPTIDVNNNIDWSKYGIKNIIIRMDVLPHENTPETWQGVHGKHPISLMLMEEFVNIKKSYSHHYLNTIPEIVIDNAGSWLAPLLWELSQMDIPFIGLHSKENPQHHTVKTLQDSFEYLQIRQGAKKNIHFLPDQSYWQQWNAASLNPFSGPSQVHIDISNKCTHSCQFCGVYSPQVIQIEKDKNGGTLSPDHIRQMNSQISREQFLSIFKDQSLNLKFIQFGGAGDPLLHPNIFEFISTVRNQGIGLEILTNLEYLDPESLQKLHSWGGPHQYDLRLIVNISGASEETYLKTRPRQSPKTFAKVINNIKTLCDLRTQYKGWGAHITMMCVLTQDNFHEAVEFISLAHELGVNQVWFKPMEIHDIYQKELLPTKDQIPNYEKVLLQALQLADHWGIDVYGRQIIENFTKKNHDDFGNASAHADTAPTSDKHVEVGILDAQTSCQLYNQVPCRVGFAYSRIEVDGSIKPCCIAKYPVGNLAHKTFLEIWQSLEYQTFRNKLGRIHIERFHTQDPEWAFCQQCAHKDLNIEYSELSKIREKDEK